MTHAEREAKIAEQRQLMLEQWSIGNRAQARFHCRVMTGLIRGRAPEVVELLEKRKGVA